MVNKHNKFFRTILVSVILCCLLLSTNAHAAFIYADGQPTTYQDLNTPNDVYFGGFNMTNPGAPNPFVGSTSLTFNLGSQQNIVHAIIGANYGGREDSLIDGDTNLIIRSTKANYILGGGYSIRTAAGVDYGVNVSGTAYIRLYDSNVTEELYGGSGATNDFKGDSYVGAVDILIDKSIVEGIVLTGRGYGNGSNLAILRDAACVIQNDSVIKGLTSTISVEADIGGNASIDVLGSRVEILSCIGEGNVNGNFFVHLGDYASKNARVDTLNLSRGGKLKGKFLCTIDAGSIENVHCMPEGVLKEARFVVGKAGSITKFMIDDQITPETTGRTEVLNIQVDGGRITNLDACAVRGSVGDFLIDVKNQGRIENLTIGRANGSGQVGVIDDLTVTLSGGTINTLAWEPLGTTTFTVRLSPGGANSIRKVSGSIDTLEVVSGSTTTIGTASSNTTLNVADMSLAGTLIIPENATLTLNVENSLVVDGGTLSVVNQDGAVPTGPVLFFDGALTDGLTITKPLEIDTSRIMSFINTGNIIPIAQAKSAGFERADLFAKRIQHQLIVGDIAFDPTTKMWSVSNIRPSENYYGYAAGRKASSWLNQQAMQAVHSHSVKTILNKHEGLWVEGQGGMENLQATVGKSEMPWSMVSVGYDYHHAVSEEVSGGYGVSLGIAGGWNKWKEEDILVRNKIQTLLGNCYAGYAYKGFYGVIGLQLAVGEVTSDNSGFETNRKWSEVTPMESFELGWKYGAFEGLNIIPRVKVLVEQLSQRTVAFNAGRIKELLTLPAEMLVSTIAGIAAEYDAKDLVGMDMTTRLGLDWIRGIAGSYAVHSKVLNYTFGEKNKNDVLRITLGGDLPLGEELRVGAQIFGDVLDNTGFGAQVTVGYMF